MTDSKRLDSSATAEDHEETGSYVLTPLGLIGMGIGKDQAQRVIDLIELHLRRHYGAPSAIVFDGEQMFFSKLATE